MFRSWQAIALVTTLCGASWAEDAGTATRPSDAEVAEGFAAIFDGQSLRGWIGLDGDASSYYVQDGMLICKATGSNHILTEKEYGNYILRLQIKMDPGGNNGVGIRTRPSREPHLYGMEIQVLDDDYYADGDPIQLKDYQHHGSIYGVVPAKTGQLKPAGEWNDQEIVCDGRHVRVTLNGTVIVDADLDKVQPIDGHEHPGLKYEKGHISLHAHGNYGAEVFFRNLRVKELNQRFKARRGGLASVRLLTSKTPSRTRAVQLRARQPCSWWIAILLGSRFGRRLGLRAWFTLQFGVIPTRIEGWVHHRNHGVGVYEKLADERVEFCDEFRSLRGEVVLLRQISSQIVEQVAMGTVVPAVEDADQLPITAVDGNGRWDPVGHAWFVREVLKDRILGEFDSFEGGEYAATVKILIGRGSSREAVEQGGVIVLTLNDLVAERPGSGDTGPDDHAGDSRASLEHRGLAASQRSVAGRRSSVHFVVHVSAVVGRENDDRVIRDSQTVDRSEQGTDGVVHAFDHRRVSGAALRIGGIGTGAMLFDQR